MTTYLQLRSLVTQAGEVELSLHPVPIPALAGEEVLVRIEATPINPSDLGLLIGPADPATAPRGQRHHHRHHPTGRHAVHGRPARPVHAGG